MLECCSQVSGPFIKKSFKSRLEKVQKPSQRLCMIDAFAIPLKLDRFLAIRHHAYFRSLRWSRGYDFCRATRMNHFRMSRSDSSKNRGLPLSESSSYPKTFDRIQCIVELIWFLEGFLFIFYGVIFVVATSCPFCCLWCTISVQTN